MIIDMLIFIFEYSDGSSRMVAFEDYVSASQFAFNEGDHLVRYYIWTETDAILCQM